MRFLTAMAVALLGASFAWGDDLAALSDEFDDASSLVRWQRVHEVEGWDALVPGRSADPWETWYIDETNDVGVIAPYTGGYYNDFIGGLAFQVVTGDFIATARLRVTARNGGPVPDSDYSLAGIMIRQAQVAVPATQWVRGVANFMFLSLGHGESGQQYEIKNTINGQSTLVLSNAISNVAIIQAVRIGQRFVFLRYTPGEGWVVHGRYDRTANPLPAALQVGMTVYTDWGKYGDYLNTTHTVDGVPNVDGVWVHNTHFLDATLPAGLEANANPYNPDIIAYYDYFRYVRPPPDAVANFTTNNFNAISNATLLGYFGDLVNRPGEADFKSIQLAAYGIEAELGGLGSGHIYRIEADPGDGWTPLPAPTLTADAARVTLALPTNSALLRAVLE
ncbi:MAG TPA: hypothetical protein PKE12_15510 [Kiritimatiellia bacterium]|nr:hypothetical protein [Kiritimatiellia bacterium]